MAVFRCFEQLNGPYQAYWTNLIVVDVISSTVNCINLKVADSFSDWDVKSFVEFTVHVYTKFFKASLLAPYMHSDEKGDVDYIFRPPV
jgi:hypothetical protein